MRTTLFDESGLAAIYPGAWARVQAAMRADATRTFSIRAAESPGTKAGSVALIPVHGVITKTSSFFSDLFGGTSLDRLEAAVLDAAADKSITSIVLHVDSPGGGVYGVDGVADTIAAVAKKKQVVAFTDGMMASAAYWLASAASRIVATADAEIGSIGVYAVHFDHSGELAAEGIVPTLIKAGEHKAEANPFQPLSDEDRGAMQARIDAYYSLFTRRVAKGRGVPVDTARGDAFGAGRVLGAQQAVSAGMADELGTIADVLRGLTRDTSSRAAQAADEMLRFQVQLAQVAG